jgi:hypothetical protein
MPYSEQFTVNSYPLMQKTAVGTQSIASAPKAKIAFKGMSASAKIERVDSHEQ